MSPSGWATMSTFPLASVEAATRKTGPSASVAAGVEVVGVAGSSGEAGDGGGQLRGERLGVHVGRAALAVDDLTGEGSHLGGRGLEGRRGEGGATPATGSTVAGGELAGFDAHEPERAAGLLDIATLGLGKLLVDPLVEERLQ